MIATRICQVTRDALIVGGTIFGDSFDATATINLCAGYWSLPRACDGESDTYRNGNDSGTNDSGLDEARIAK
jgi:hypothetical protein